jgi:hypothetical protein
MPVNAQANRDYSWQAWIPCNRCGREHQLPNPTSHHVDQITCFPNEFDGTKTGYTAWWYIYSNTQHFAQWAVKWRCSPTAASLTQQNWDVNVSDPKQTVSLKPGGTCQKRQNMLSPTRSTPLNVVMCTACCVNAVAGNAMMPLPQHHKQVELQTPMEEVRHKRSAAQRHWLGY